MTDGDTWSVMVISSLNKEITHMFHHTSLHEYELGYKFDLDQFFCPIFCTYQSYDIICKRFDFLVSFSTDDEYLSNMCREWNSNIKLMSTSSIALWYNT